METINNKLKNLRSEYIKGQQRMAELKSELEQVRNTMLRISGAIQVLEELQDEESLPDKSLPDNG